MTTTAPAETVQIRRHLSGWQIKLTDPDEIRRMGCTWLALHVSPAATFDDVCVYLERLREYAGRGVRWVAE